jgi:tetratricopeptide (TPR) repeat protein
MVRRLFTPESRRGPRVPKALVYFMRCITSLIGVRTLTVDVRGAIALARYVEPLEGFGAKHAGRAIYFFCKSMALEMLGRESDADRMSERAIEMLNDPNACPELHAETRQSLLAGLWLQRGVNECVRDDSRALEVAGELEHVGTKIADVAAHQIRMIYHLVRGETERAGKHREKVEMHGLQGGTTWQVELFVAIHEGLSSGTQRNIVGLKRAVENLNRLSKEVPTLLPYYEITRAFQLYHRGEYQMAGEIADGLMSFMKPRNYVAWYIPRVLKAMVLNRLGDHQQAKEICAAALGDVSADDRRYFLMYGFLEFQLAMAEAGLGNVEQAAEMLDQLISVQAPYEQPAVLFFAHEYRARVALMAKDDAAYQSNLKQVRIHAQATQNPAFLAHCERFADQGTKAGMRESTMPLLDEGEEVATSISAPRSDDIVKRVLSECERWQDRAQRVLHLIGEQARASMGYIYLLRDGELELAGTLGREQPPDGLEQRALQFLESGDEDDEDTHLSDMGRATETTYGDPAADESRNKWAYRLMMLSVARTGRESPIGVVALAVGEEPLAPIKTELLEAVARRLQ